MAKLSKEAVEALAVGAWGVAHGTYVIRQAVEIARLESGFETTAHNAKPPDNSYGLWQINMLGAMGTERRKQYGLRSNTDLFDPITNARVAYGIWEAAGKSFSPWSTAAQADKNLSEGARTSPTELIPVVGDVASWANSLATILGTLLQASFWKRLGIGALGIGIVLAGLIFITMKSDTGKAALGIASKAVTKGKA